MTFDDHLDDLPRGGRPSPSRRSQGDAPGPSPDRIALTPWLARLRIAIVRARDERDPEGVHELRIAIARLRVWLAFKRDQSLDDELHWLRNRAAAVRDLDVQLAYDPPPSIARRLTRRRRAASRQLLDALDSPRLAALLEALADLAPAKRSRAERRLRRLARTALARGRFVRRHPNDSDGRHALRRALRRARFALEWLGSKARPLADLQDALGEVGDRAQALTLARTLHRDGARVRAWRRRLARELEAAAHLARRRWKKARKLLVSVV